MNGDVPSNFIALPEGLRLQRNLAILASAGTGKTYNLVTLCLHVLSGAREGHEATSPANLGLLTFTDKAAGELCHRLRARLAALARGAAEEPELRASFEALRRPFPRSAFWRKLNDALGAATICTFHGLCMRLLRWGAPAVTSNLQLLDASMARALLQEAVEEVVLEEIEAGNESISQLVSEFGLRDRGAFGLVHALVPVVTSLREEGQSPEALPMQSLDVLRKQFEDNLEALKNTVQRGYGAVGKFAPTLDEFHRILAQASFETWSEDALRLWQIISRKRAHPFGVLKDFIRSDVSALSPAERMRHVGLAHGACVMLRHELALKRALSRILQRYQRFLDRRHAVDFTGLLVQTRDMLRDHLHQRLAAQARFQVLLVDELQDANRLQLELVLLLAERRDGAPRVIRAAGEGHLQALEYQLPLQPASVAVVGDRKQAIYEFRGADVSISQVMMQAIVRSGGGCAFLQDSRRTSPELVEVLNRVASRVLDRVQYGASTEDFETVYEAATDDLRSLRPRCGDASPYVAFVSSVVREAPLDAVAFRLADADAIARGVANLVHSGTHEVSRGGMTRRMRGGDVALLFQRFTQLEYYRQALLRYGVRHRVVRGRGFYGAQEVMDVASFLWLLVDPQDTLCMAAVLRSPFVGLSDTSLLRCAVPQEPGASFGLCAKRLAQQFPAGLTEWERTRLKRFFDVYWVLQRERARLGLRPLLRVIFDAFSWRVVISAGPYGEQAVANTDKLLQLATRRELQGVGVAAFARELFALADVEPKDAQAEVVGEADREAVTLCTVHQAKGLEWPIVVLPELSAQRLPLQSPVLFDRTLGLALKPFHGASQSLHAQNVAVRGQRRARAESLRLLYVALTRARDRIALGLLPRKPRVGTWAFELAAAHATPLEIDTAASQVVPPPEDYVLPADIAKAQVQAVFDRVRRVVLPAPSKAILSVTQLQNFITCPKRFHLRQRFPEGLRRRAEEAALDARARGVLAHQLLQRTTLSIVGTQALSKELQRAGKGDLLAQQWTERFWNTAFGRRIAMLGEARVHREFPFLFSLRDRNGFELIVKGQWDILIEEDTEVLLVDYKTSHFAEAGLEPYVFQLNCYLLAARHFVAHEMPVRAGVVFLKDADCTAHFIRTPMEQSSLESTLLHQAQELMRAQAAFCRALRCAHEDRCHSARG